MMKSSLMSLMMMMMMMSGLLTLLIGTNNSITPGIGIQQVEATMQMYLKFDTVGPHTVRLPFFITKAGQGSVSDIIGKVEVNWNEADGSPTSSEITKTYPVPSAPYYHLVEFNPSSGLTATSSYKGWSCAYAFAKRGSDSTGDAEKSARFCESLIRVSDLSNLPNLFQNVVTPPGAFYGCTKVQIIFFGTELPYAQKHGTAQDNPIEPGNNRGLSAENWQTFESFCQGCTELHTVDFGDANAHYYALNNYATSTDWQSLTSVKSMFKGATKIQQMWDGWGIFPFMENVNDFSYSFAETGMNIPADAIKYMDALNLSSATTLEKMFYQSSIRVVTSNWNTHKVHNFRGVWEEAHGPSDSGDSTSKWDMRQATDVSSMFKSMAESNPITTNWNLYQVQNLENMFAFSAKANPNVQNWNLESASTIKAMFRAASIAEPNTENWNLHKCVSFQSVFRDSIANPKMSKWNTFSAQDMELMFSGNNNVIAGEEMGSTLWVTTNFHKVTNMNSMFSDASKANPNTAGWRLNKLKSAASMFKNAPNALVPIGGDAESWVLENIESLHAMFEKAVNAQPNLSNINFTNNNGKLTGMEYTFMNCCSATNVSPPISLQSLFPSPYVLSWPHDLEARGLHVEAFNNMDFHFAGVVNADPSGFAYAMSSRGASTAGLTSSNAYSLTSMSGVFKDCCRAQTKPLDLSGWQTKKVTTMANLFANYQAGGGNTVQIATGVGTTTTAKASEIVFFGAHPDLAGTQYGYAEYKVVKFGGGPTENNPTHPGFTTESVTKLDDMFRESWYIDPDLYWGFQDLRKVTSMRRMFFGARGITLAPGGEINTDVDLGYMDSGINDEILTSYDGNGAVSDYANHDRIVPAGSRDGSSPSNGILPFHIPVSHRSTANKFYTGVRWWRLDSLKYADFMFTNARSARPDVRYWNTPALYSAVWLFFNCAGLWPINDGNVVLEEWLRLTDESKIKIDGTQGVSGLGLAKWNPSPYGSQSFYRIMHMFGPCPRYQYVVHDTSAGLGIGGAADLARQRASPLANAASEEFNDDSTISWAQNLWGNTNVCAWCGSGTALSMDPVSPLLQSDKLKRYALPNGRACYTNEFCNFPLTFEDYADYAHSARGFIITAGSAGNVMANFVLRRLFTLYEPRIWGVPSSVYATLAASPCRLGGEATIRLDVTTASMVSPQVFVFPVFSASNPHSSAVQNTLGNGWAAKGGTHAGTAPRLGQVGLGSASSSNFPCYVYIDWTETVGSQPVGTGTWVDRCYSSLADIHADESACLQAIPTGSCDWIQARRLGAEDDTSSDERHEHNRAQEHVQNDENDEHKSDDRHVQSLRNEGSATSDEPSNPVDQSIKPASRRKLGAEVLLTAIGHEKQRTGMKWSITSTGIKDLKIKGGMAHWDWRVWQPAGSGTGTGTPAGTIDGSLNFRKNFVHAENLGNFWVPFMDYMFSDPTGASMTTLTDIPKFTHVTMGEQITTLASTSNTTKSLLPTLVHPAPSLSGISRVRSVRGLFWNNQVIAEATMGKAGTWNMQGVTDIGYLFNGASKITLTALMGADGTTPVPCCDNWIHSTTKDIDYAFANMASIGSDGDGDGIGDGTGAGVTFDWDTTSELTSMIGTFSGNNKLVINNFGSKMNTESVTSMKDLFYGLQSQTPGSLNLTAVSTDNVYSMEGMFREYGRIGGDTAEQGSLSDISHFVTNKVTNMKEMFRDATYVNPNTAGLYQSIGGASISGVWDLKSAITLEGMFKGAENANPNVLLWNVQKVTSMASLFEGASRANPDISRWMTTSCNTMREMFKNAFEATAPTGNGASSFQVTEVKDMEGMFLNAYKSNPDISEWSTSKVTTMKDLFNNANVAVLATPNGWDATKAQNMERMFRNCAASTTAFSKWRVSDVTSMEGIFEGIGTMAELSFTENFHVNKLTSLRRLFEGYAYAGALSGGMPRGLESWNIAQVNDLSEMFLNCQSCVLGGTELASWNTNQVTDMTRLFANCTNVEGANFDDWNLAAVTSTEGMFLNAVKISPNVFGWNTMSLTNAQSMFENTQSATDLATGSWNVYKLVNANSMFKGTNANGNVTLWNVQSIRDLSSMFEFAERAQPDLSKWNPVAATKSDFMLRGASTARPNLANWKNANKLTSLAWMFFGTDFGNIGKDVLTSELGKTHPLATGLDKILDQWDWVKQLTSESQLEFLIDMFGPCDPRSIYIGDNLGFNKSRTVTTPEQARAARGQDCEACPTRVAFSATNLGAGVEVPSIMVGSSSTPNGLSCLYGCSFDQIYWPWMDYQSGAGGAEIKKSTGFASSYIPTQVPSINLLVANGYLTKDSELWKRLHPKPCQYPNVAFPEIPEVCHKEQKSCSASLLLKDSYGNSMRSTFPLYSTNSDGVSEQTGAESCRSWCATQIGSEGELGMVGLYGSSSLGIWSALSSYDCMCYRMACFHSAIDLPRTNIMLLTNPACNGQAKGVLTVTAETTTSTQISTTTTTTTFSESENSKTTTSTQTTSGPTTLAAQTSSTTTTTTVFRVTNEIGAVGYNITFSQSGDSLTAQQRSSLFSSCESSVAYLNTILTAGMWGFCAKAKRIDAFSNVTLPGCPRMCVGTMIYPCIYRALPTITINSNFDPNNVASTAVFDVFSGLYGCPSVVTNTIGTAAAPTRLLTMLELGEIDSQIEQDYLDQGVVTTWNLGQSGVEGMENYLQQAHSRPASEALRTYLERGSPIGIEDVQEPYGRNVVDNQYLSQRNLPGTNLQLRLRGNLASTVFHLRRLSDSSNGLTIEDRIFALYGSRLAADGVGDLPPITQAEFASDLVSVTDALAGTTPGRNSFTHLPASSEGSSDTVKTFDKFVAIVKGGASNAATYDVVVGNVLKQLAENSTDSFGTPAWIYTSTPVKHDSSNTIAEPVTGTPGVGTGNSTLGTGGSGNSKTSEPVGGFQHDSGNGSVRSGPNAPAAAAGTGKTGQQGNYYLMVIAGVLGVIVLGVLGVVARAQALRKQAEKQAKIEKNRQQEEQDANARVYQQTEKIDAELDDDGEGDGSMVMAMGKYEKSVTASSYLMQLDAEMFELGTSNEDVTKGADFNQLMNEFGKTSARGALGNSRAESKGLEVLGQDVAKMKAEEEDMLKRKKSKKDKKDRKRDGYDEGGNWDTDKERSKKNKDRKKDRDGNEKNCDEDGRDQDGAGESIARKGSRIEALKGRSSEGSKKEKKKTRSKRGILTSNVDGIGPGVQADGREGTRGRPSEGLAASRLDAAGNILDESLNAVVGEFVRSGVTGIATGGAARRQTRMAKKKSNERIRLSDRKRTEEGERSEKKDDEKSDKKDAEKNEKQGGGSASPRAKVGKQKSDGKGVDLSDPEDEGVGTKISDGKMEPDRLDTFAKVEKTKDKKTDDVAIELNISPVSGFGKHRDKKTKKADKDKSDSDKRQDNPFGKRELGNETDNKDNPFRKKKDEKREEKRKSIRGKSIRDRDLGQSSAFAESGSTFLSAPTESREDIKIDVVRAHMSSLEDAEETDGQARSLRSPK